jgi:hypothetical protein
VTHPDDSSNSASDISIHRKAILKLPVNCSADESNSDVLIYAHAGRSGGDGLRQALAIVGGIGKNDGG